MAKLNLIIMVFHYVTFEVFLATYVNHLRLGKYCLVHVPEILGTFFQVFGIHSEQLLIGKVRRLLEEVYGKASIHGRFLLGLVALGINNAVT